MYYSAKKTEDQRVDDETGGSPVSSPSWEGQFARDGNQWTTTRPSFWSKPSSDNPRRRLPPYARRVGRTDGVGTVPRRGATRVKGVDISSGLIRVGVLR